ncbi:hypothetical protein CL634_05965 [bacterium]|nr:hypothetical protein [bacterium]|tara:strand:+ start:1251 stop:3299 length:2049 start_codon:yes stop_codon:yes gene_type:complete
MGKSKRKSRKGKLPKNIQSKYDASKNGRKKKILYHSDFSLLKTGFGRAARLILTHLYNTNKYEIVHFCCGLPSSHPEFPRLPWKSIGALPTDIKANEAIQRDPKLAQLASYGANTIDKVMKEETPDVYIGVQDIWGCDFVTQKGWFNPSNMAIWTTLDSLPILPMAVKAASDSKHFWCWSDFATKSLHDLGHKHVKTLRGPLDRSNYYKLDNLTRSNNRKKFGIAEDAFIVGFVFRNQLRKSVPNLLEGYKKFLDDNPELSKRGSKLLLHTNFSEGWNIHRLANEAGVDKQDILTTYCCFDCGSYGIHTFEGQQQKCPYCNKEKSYSTTGIQAGVTEEQLNEVYNFMDVYCHPFTSGGQEIPIQEAKLTELITLVTNYSCGVDSCTEEACSLPLDWSKYREHGTEFIKASTLASSIAEQLTAVYKMPVEKRKEIGARARQWVIDYFSIDKIGKTMEEFIDTASYVDKDIYNVKSKKNPQAEIDPSLQDKEWLFSMYKKILDMNVDEKDAGHLYWMGELGKNTARENVETFFRETAKKDLKEVESIDDLWDKEEEGKKILYVIPESAGDVFLATGLFDSLKEQYPDYKLYVATRPQFVSIMEGNPHVHKVIEYDPRMETIHLMEGWGSRPTEDIVYVEGIPQRDVSNHEGYFDICFLSHVNTQRISCYTHNGLDKIAFDIKDF